MNEEKITVIAKECDSYFEMMGNTYPNFAPNTFDLYSLTLGVMFRRHPSRIGEINKEVIDKVSSNELYSVFKNQVVEKAKNENWQFVLETEKLKQASKREVSRKKVFNPKLIEKVVERNRVLKQQVMLLKSTSPIIKPVADYYRANEELNSKYRKAADNLISVWNAFIDYKNRKNMTK